MQEPEVSLRIAMHYIESGKTCADVTVSIDGAHVKTKDVVHFDLTDFMRQSGYMKCDGDNFRWQGTYQADPSLPKIIVSSKPGIGDVATAHRSPTAVFPSCQFQLNLFPLLRPNNGRVAMLHIVLGNLALVDLHLFL